MNKEPKKLLVEAEADQKIFKVLCKKLLMDKLVDVILPTDIIGNYTTKPAIFNALPFVCQSYIADKNWTHLAVIMDADFLANHSLGYQKTLEKFIETLSPNGYSITENSNQQIDGLFFKHDEGLAGIGLWIMPNNKDEGMFENWLKSNISLSEENLFNHAVKVVGEISNPKFSKETHSQKTEIATWLVIIPQNKSTLK